MCVHARQCRLCSTRRRRDEFGYPRFNKSFPLIDGYRTKVHDNRLVIAADQDEIYCLGGVEVESPMRYIGCKVDEITRAYLCGKFEPLTQRIWLRPLTT